MADVDSLLVAYADGELEPETIAEVESLLAANPHAAEKLQLFRETAALLRAACAEGFYGGPGSVITLPAPSHARFERRWSWAVAAGLIGIMVGFGGGRLWSTQPPSAHAELVNELASYHPVYSRETKHLVEVSADQTDHLKAWLGQRIQRPLLIPDLTASGLRFAGGRMVVANGKPVAQLIYTREGGLPIAICIAQLPGDASPIQVEHRDMLRVASWGDAGYAYVVVGEFDDAKARDLAALAAAQLKS
jgi:anti-sigma factor RsiW